MTQNVREQMIALLPRLRRFAYSLCGAPDQADDLVQAACERALSRLEQFEAGSRLDSWLFRIIQTTWIDGKRSAYQRHRIVDEEAMAATGFDARIHEQAEARSDLEVIRVEMSRMPEEQRVVLALVSVDGMTYQEAADALGIPIGTVMSRLARARRKLADALDRTEDTPAKGGAKAAAGDGQ